MFGKYKQSITNKLVSTYTNKKLFKKSFSFTNEWIKRK